MTLLEPLFEKIGPLDEGSALCVCFLLLDVYIEMSDIDSFKNVISHLELLYANLLKKEENQSSYQFQDLNKILSNINEEKSGAVRSTDSISSHTDDNAIEISNEYKNISFPTISKIKLTLLNPHHQKTGNSNMVNNSR